MESKIKASRMLDEFFFHKLSFLLLSMYSPKTCFSGWCPLMPLINLQNSNFHSTKLPNVTKYSNSMHSLCSLNRKCNSNRNSADLKMNFRCHVNFSSRKSYVKQTCVGNVHCYVKSILCVLFSSAKTVVKVEGWSTFHCTIAIAPCVKRALTPEINVEVEIRWHLVEGCVCARKRSLRCT